MNTSRTLLSTAIAAAVLALSVSAHAASTLTHTKLWTNNSGSGVGGAEIVAVDTTSQRAFVTNAATQSVDVLNLNTGAYITSLSGVLSGFNGGPNSVAVKNGVVAIALANESNKTQAGRVAFYNASTGALLNSVSVGALPDMLTFTHDGSKLLVANEGEPNSYNQVDSVDPEGSVSIIDMTPGAAAINNSHISTAGFSGFDKNTLQAQGVRIYGPNASVAQDIEPEYISVSPDGTKAFVTLQENNAVAVIDLATNNVTQIQALGTKNHNVAGNGLDASDKDGIDIHTSPVKGMYMPDTIASYEKNGVTYVVTANEGDARDYTGFNEEKRVSALNLDDALFPNEVALKNQNDIGRLTVSTVGADSDNDGDVDNLFAFGARSFSIRDENGNLIFDSGDQFEQYLAANHASVFNVSNNNLTVDDRSDNKGPEPEALAIGEIGDQTYAFIGLERVGGFFIFNITDANNASIEGYINDRNYNAAISGDSGPEGMTFVKASDSPSGKAMLLVASELSGTTTAYEFTAVPVPAAAWLMGSGLLGLAGLRRRNR
jgi:YVTN family beta-propeller protein